MKESAVRGECQRGHISYLVYNGPLWSDPNIGEGLTIFAINANPKQSSEVRIYELRAALKSQHDIHLDDDTLNFLSKQDTYFPKDFNEMDIQLATFCELLSVYFGAESLITLAFKQAHDHMLLNHRDYTGQIGSNNVFCTKVLYSYDLALQKHLSHLMDMSVPFDQTSYTFIEENFRQIQNDVINRRLVVFVPTELLAQVDKKRKRNDGDDNAPVAPAPRENQRKRQAARPNADAPTDRLVNPRPNPKWTTPRSIQFKVCFYKNNKIEAPTHNDTPFCLQFFCLNLCKRGQFCNLIHTDPRDIGMEAAFDAFCQKAYSA